MSSIGAHVRKSTRGAVHQTQAGSGPKGRVAFLVYDWSVRLMGGSIRAITFVRALPALGWDVLVITASPPDEWPEMPAGVEVHYIPSPERGFGGGISADTDESRLDANPGWLRRLSSIKKWLPLERQISWFPAFFRSAPARCRDAGISAVVTVVAPNVMMPLGHFLAARLGVPHFIDLRDDYADRHRVEPISSMYQRILSQYGDFFTRRAEAITVVSPVTRDRFVERGVDARLIMNGYVEDHFAGVPWLPVVSGAGGSLRVVHLGWLGNFRSIAPVVEAISELKESERQALRLEHHGLLDPEQARLLGECACETVIGPQIDHAQAIRLMVEADVLLAIPGDQLPAAMSGKLFEYLRARRPILLVAGSGAARDLAVRAGVGTIAEPQDVAGIARCLRGLMKDKRAGDLSPASEPGFVETLERSTGSRQLSSLLQEVLS
jgi:glycosyltransferase involved in cell wall biosynthesis